MVRAYLVSSFSGDLVLSIFYIYLPLFAHELGASTLEVGIVGGGDYLSYSFLPFLLGRFSDKLKSRMLLIVLALGLISVSSLLYAIAPNAETLVIVRLFEGIGWSALWPAVESGISETANENSQKALGQYNFVWSFGAMLGPLVGALLIFSVSIRTTFLITAGILLATLLVNLPKVRTSKNRLEPKEINLVDGRGHNPKDLRQTLVRLISKNRVLITTNVVVAMSVSTLLTFFPPYANSIGVSILMIGVLTFSFTASRFITYLIVLRENVRRRIISIESRNRTALVAMGCASISGVFLAFRTFGSASYFLGFVLLGSSFAVVTTIIQVAMIVEAPPSQMGAGAGFVESAIGIGSFLGPVIAGLVSGGSFLVPFFVPLVIFLLVLPVLGLVPNS